MVTLSRIFMYFADGILKFDYAPSNFFDKRNCIVCGQFNAMGIVVELNRFLVDED